MAIDEKLQKLNDDLLSAYNKIEEMGGTLPNALNSNNLASAIATIPQGPKPWWEETDILTEDDIGTTREVEVNGQIHTVRLIDIDHDDLADGTGKAHTTWQFTNLLSDSNGYSLAALWQDTATTSDSNYDFPNSTMRKCLDGLGSGTLAWYEKGGTTKSTTYTKPVIEMLPQGLQNVLKNVYKPIGVNTGSWVVNLYDTKVFLLSYSEITSASSQYTLKEGIQYAYWQTHDTDADRIMYQLKWHDGALTNSTDITDPLYGSGHSYAGYNSLTASDGGIQRLRSPNIYYAAQASYVRVTGELSGYGSVLDQAFAVAPCFCI